ncbi:MAG: hypothetical protein JXA15_09495 [Spirochaetales bacterium]|nr:hypothetical protein [Spirochaetales bacterium]
MNKRIPTLVALAALALCSYAQEAGFRLDAVDYEIDGITRRFVLELAAEIELGRSFETREQLDAYAEEIRQRLSNQRQLESVDVEVAVDESSVPASATLLIRTKDSWNIIALPQPKYDSNSGLQLNVKARDYNFLGTFQKLSIDLIYEDDLAGTRTFELYSNVSVPFMAWGLVWSASFTQSLGWVLGDASGSAYSADAGLGVSLPLGALSLGLSVNQGLSLNELDDDGTRFDDFWYLRNSASASIGGALFEDVGILRTVSWNAYTGIGGNWRPGGDVGDSRRGPTWSLGAGLSGGGSDWIGNFRKGVTTSLSAPWSYNLWSGDWTGRLDFSANGFLPLGLIGPSGRVRAFGILTGASDTAAGGDIRGILNARVSADKAVFMNLDLPARVLVFDPESWFGKSWMRYFGFELQASVFADAGLTDLSGAWLGSGMELLVFPSAARSLIGRVSFGVDPIAVIENRSLTAPSSRDGAGAYEIFIGLDTHY